MLHGNSWAFGRSPSRDDAIWHSGVAAEQVHKRAVRQAMPGKGVNTANGINRALDTAQHGQKQKDRDGLGVSWDRETSTWHQDTPNGNHQPDEEFTLEALHKVRAYADVDAANNLNLNVGPELILKDSHSSRLGHDPDQPDSALGMGMQLKYVF